MADDQFTDAIALLKADHRTVEDLYETARSDARKRDIAHRICVELKIHTMIEEEIFYPAFRGRSRMTRLAMLMSSMTAPRC